MSTNNIAKWAALLLTFSGMAALPLTASAVSRAQVTAGQNISETNQSYDDATAIPIVITSGTYSGTNITLNATRDTFSTVSVSAQGKLALYSSTLTVNGAGVNAGIGLSGSSQAVLNQVSITTQGGLGRGVSSINGSLLVANNVTVETSSSSAHGFYLGSGTANLDAITVITHGNVADAVTTPQADAVVNLSNARLVTNGAWSHAVNAAIVGATVNLAKVTVELNGGVLGVNPSIGLRAISGGVISGTAVTIAGHEYNRGVSVSSGGVVELWDSSMALDGDNSTGISSNDNGSVLLHDTAVTMTGSSSNVINLNNGTVWVDGGTLATADGKLVYVTGAADSNVTLNNVNTASSGGIVSGTGADFTGTSNVTISGGNGVNGGISHDGLGDLNITLNDSSLTGNSSNTGGTLNISGTNSVITGTIIGSGSSTTNINLNNSSLTGASTVSDSGTINLSLANGAVWNLTGSSSVTTLSNNGSIIIANALGEDLSVSGAFAQDADGTLDLNISGTDPIITAGTASISGTLKVSGFVSGTLAAKASEIIAKNFTVIHTTDGISGEFTTADFGLAASTVDYITLAAGLTNSNRDYTLNYGLSWFAASSTSHGNFTIASGTSFEIDIVLSDTAAGQGAGGWDGTTLTKLGGGTLIISSSNNFTGGANIESGTLRLSNLNGAGSGTVNVAQTILSVLDLSGSGEYKNDTTGQGTIILSGSGVNISGNNSTFAGAWDVTGSGTMISQNNLGVSGSTAVNIAQNGALSLILGTGDYHFDQPLTGSGYLLLQNAGNVSLVPSVPLVAYVPAFTGTVALERNTLALTAANALPLSLATLVTGTNNLVVVDSDPSATARNIGALSFSGGTVRFEGYDPHATRADTIIALTGTLSLSGGGTVEVVMPNPSQIPDGSKFTHIPLLQQDDGLALTLLISASGGVTGSPAALALRDDNGRVVSDSYTLNLSHDGITTDAIGTYDYLLSTGSANDGLYVAFGLKQADIQAGRTLTLDQDTTTPAEGDDFTATIIGSGNLQINATASITLNGTGNSYSGTTIVNTGTLLVGINEQMFASSTAFVINSGAALNTNGTDQLVNNLSGSGLATFTNNTLTVNNSSSTSFSGILTGGKLVKDGSAQLDANNATANLNQVQINNGSLLLGANATVSASGQPAVLANGGTATFNASSLSTSGSVLILAKDNAPATLNLNSMTVSVVGNLVEANNGALTVTLNDSTTTGKTAVANGGALNLGLNNSVWNLTGKSKLTTLTSSGGTITIDNVQGEDLVVTSGITGQTALNLTLSDSVKGNQEIWVVVDETNNMTGERFTLSHEVSYGMYNYNLVNNSDGAWLVYTGSSGTIPPVNPPPVNPPTISDEGDTIINTAAAVAGFWFTQLDNLHKRMGELRYNKPAGADLITNIWIRTYGQQINANTGIYSVKGFAETQYGVDLGTDYLWKLDADNQLYTGIFAGYGGADRDFHTNYSGNTDSGYGGLYATWLNKDGWYADVVAKGQYFRNSFDGEDHAEYDSLGAGISLEVGNMFEFKDGWFVEPSVQFSYLHLMNDNYTTRDGLHVDLTDADVLHIYGGARFGRNIELTNSGILQPYIKAGGLGQISSGNKLTVSGDHWRPNLDGARAVVGAGLIWQLDADSQLHLDYEASFGEKYDKPWGVNFGYRYQF